MAIRRSILVTHCVVPPIRIAGGAPLKLCKLERHVAVPSSSTYPGNAKNSMETLSRDASTVTAEEGIEEGTANAVVVCATAPFLETPKRMVASRTSFIE